MSTLKTNNIEHLDATSPSIEVNAAGGIQVGGALTATTGTFSGNVSIAGVLSYEDVTNIDSVGIITAQSGLRVTGGNVGIGTDSPNYSLQIHTAATELNYLQFTNDDTGGTSSDGFTVGINDSDEAIIYQRSLTQPIRVLTNGAERMRIDSSGRVGIGTFSPNELLEVRGTENQGIRLTSTASSGEGANLQWYSEQAGDNKITAEIESDGQSSGGNLFFKTRSTAGTLTDRVIIDNAGNITFTTKAIAIESDGFGDPRIRADSNPITVLAGSSNGVKLALNAGTWTNLSDENVKTDLEPIENAFEKVKQVRTVTGRFVTDDENVRRAFLIAQDFQSVLPEAVVEFEPGKLGLNYTDVIPLLAAALKESIGKIETLEAEIAALKGS